MLYYQVMRQTVQVTSLKHQNIIYLLWLSSTQYYI